MKIRGLIFPIVTAVSLSVAGVAAAQSPAPRMEIGVQVSLLRRGDFDATSTGIGGRVSFDVTRWAAVEGEDSFFPNDEVRLSPSTLTPDLLVSYERKRTDVFFGVKLEARKDSFGVFATVRPGLTRLTGGGAKCVGRECALVLLALPEYRTELALNLGGGLELYPSARTVARFELGDTVIRHRSVAAPCPAGGCSSHNLSMRLGVGFRF